MKFVFNFIFYGLLFYIIWFYFPDAFNTLISWVTSLFQFLQELAMRLVDLVKSAASK